MRYVHAPHPWLLFVSLGIVGCAAASVVAPVSYHVWVYETGSQLLWSSDEAYLVIRTRQEGWHGGVLSRLWQMLRNASGAPTSTRVSLDAAVAFTFGREGLQQFNLRGARVSLLWPEASDVYSRVNGVTMRWTSTGIAPPREAVLSDSATRVGRLGNYDGTEGWSNRSNFLYWGQTGITHRITVADHDLEFTVHAPTGFREQRVILKIDDGPHREIWFNDTAKRDLSRDQYAAVFEGADAGMAR